MEWEIHGETQTLGMWGVIKSTDVLLIRIENFNKSKFKKKQNMCKINKMCIIFIEGYTPLTNKWFGNPAIKKYVIHILMYLNIIFYKQ